MIKYLAVYIFSLLIHPVHVSMSSMEHVPGEEGYKITVRMYSDDLLLDLLSLYQLPGEHIDDHIYTGPDDIYQDYINERLKVKINGQHHSAKLLESEKLEIETILRLFIKHGDPVNNVEISNTILTGIYMDQVNLFIYKDDNNEQAVRFTASYMNEKINLEEKVLP
ncbi:MAG: DUF6702 family protein [Bacteroidales bacterium]|jgi:hypothetical protein|nr:DUF6702 family protein [Bacteroidales bacterium]